jgi:hypothetical protein
MINHNRFLTAALLCALGASLAAPGLLSAQPMPGGRGPVPFGAMDLNDDGAISAQEFAEHRAQRQAARAAQGRPMRNAGQGPRFEDWDQDGDGLLTPQELAEGQQARFAARRSGWRSGWGPGWNPGMDRGWGPGWGQGWGPGPGSGSPCWRNP